MASSPFTAVFAQPRLDAAQSGIPSPDLLGIDKVLVCRVGRDGRIKHVEDQVQGILGFQPDELVGKAALEYLHPDDVAGRYGLLKRLVSLADRGENLDLRFQRKDGTWCLLRTRLDRGSLCPEGELLVTATSLSDIPLLEEVVRDGEDRFRSLVESIGDVVTLLDARGTIRYQSRSTERILGYQPSEVEGTCLFDGIHPDDVTTVRECFDSLLPGREAPVEYRCRHKDGSWRIFDAVIRHFSEVDGGAITMTSRDFTDRRGAERELYNLTSALQNAAEGIARLDQSGSYLHVNQAYANMFASTPDDLGGRDWREGIHPDDQDRLMDAYHQMRATGKVEVEVRGFRMDARLFFARIIMVAAYDDSGGFLGHHSFVKDVTAWKELGSQLRQSQRLEAIGHLAAGVAHEINTPVQYVGDNLRFLEEGFASLSSLLEVHRSVLAACGVSSEGPNQIAAAERELDIDYLLAEIPKALQQGLDGIERIARIARAMKEFSHPGSNEKLPTDLNHAIESTLTVSRNEWKYVADVETNFEANLPLVPCLLGDFNQVILNIVVNAAHAVADVVGETGERGQIVVSTAQVGDWAEVRISDTGPGIPVEVRPRIFDPFFTTKEVGRGTGQGLTLAHSVVVDKHGGLLTFESKLGKGTVFIIRLPLEAVTSDNFEGGW